MGKGKSQFCTWFCGTCNQPNGLSYYPRNRGDEIMKEKKMFCNNAKCRTHVLHKRKDTKKGS